MPADHGATESIARARGRAVGGAPRIAAVSGPGAGRTFAMTQSLATVGRHATNDLVVADSQVSGVHLELSRVGDRVRMRDAGSTNGTWIGGVRVGDAELGIGTEVVIGSTTLRFEFDEAASAPPQSDRASFGELVGRSPAMRELFATLARIAPKNLTVLVHGETGTGKEEVARAIHAASNRASGPFVVIDATSLPETLAEALLFGHEKGAFTGATDRRPGYFEAAHGGTVFIDEIGELPAALQSKFLRVLERREVVRVGRQDPVPVDVRVVAATHRDLRHEIDAGRFREDLFFRIAQMRIRLPPLRDRPEDIAPLCEKLLAGAGERAMTIEPDALAYLEQQPWPGNVRELRNALARAAAMATGDVLRRGDVAGEGDGFRGTRDERAVLEVSGTFADDKQRAIDRFESTYLSTLLKRSEGNISKASRAAGMARHHLRELLRKHGLYSAPSDDE